jgi:tetratricopeptide (TPR) repeat protein
MVPTVREFTRNSRRVEIRFPSTGCCRPRSVTCLCVEDQLHQMTELCPVLADRRRSVRNFGNGFGILDRRIVVGAMHDDHIQCWNDENEVSSVAARGIDSGKRDFREMNTAVIHPPEIFVTNRAIQEDPSDARGYAGLAQCYIVLPMMAKTSQTEAYQKARDAAVKALALDDSLAEAHLAIAEVKLYGDWDFAGAENEFKKTLGLNPNYSTGHQWYGEFLSLMARHPEAIRELQIAVALDPLSPVVHLQFGNTLQQARQYDQALDQYREALKIDPKFSLPFHAMHWAYRRQGKFAESIEPLRAALQSWDAKNDWIALVDQLPAAYSKGGRTGYLRQCVKIDEHSERPWFYLARDYADLGNREAALAALNKSYENRHLEVLWLLVDPELDPLRSDPRFQQLTREIGFPQSSSEVGLKTEVRVLKLISASWVPTH